MENSERLLGAFWPIRVHSTAENCSDPLCCRRSSLFQEALSLDASGSSSIYVFTKDTLAPYFKKQALVSISSLDNSPLTGESANAFGKNLLLADLNKDSIPELIVGSPLTNQVLIYTLSGKVKTLKATIRLPGTESLGSALQVLDLNGDGYLDIAMGASSANPINDSAGNLAGYGGAIYVLKGTSSLPVDTLLSTSTSAVNWAFNGATNLTGKGNKVSVNPSSGEMSQNQQTSTPFYDRVGNALAVLDLNHDGHQDLAIGAPNAAVGSGYTATANLGKVYVLFGNQNPTLNNLSHIVAGLGAVFQGILASGQAGWEVANGKDVNNDNIDDLLIGAPFAYGNAGSAYVAFGSSNAYKTNPAIQLDPNVPNSRVFQYQGVANPLAGNNYINLGNVGQSLGGVGDINGDYKLATGGYDIILGAPSSRNQEGQGQIYAAVGHPWLQGGLSLNVGNLRGDNGFIELNPQAAVGVGDVNGDGFMDFVNLGNLGATIKINQLTLGGSTLSNVNQQNSYSLSSLATDVALVTNGDFNADGYQDIAAFDRITNNIVIHLGGSNIQAAAQFLAPAPANLIQVTSGDVDGDGYEDLLTFGSLSGGGQGQVAIYCGSASGLNSQAAVNQIMIDPNSSSAASGNAIHVADLNGDSIDEIFLMASALVQYPHDTIYSNYPSIWNYSNTQISLAKSLGPQEINTGMLTTGAIGSKEVRISSGDFDGDGIEDVLYSLRVSFANSSNFGIVYDQVFYGGTQPGMGVRTKLIKSGNTSQSSFLNSAQTSTAVGDVNADGFDDILLNQGFPSDPSFLYLGGHETTSLTVSIPIQGLPNRQTIYQTGQTGDINGDGYDDFLMADLDKGLTYAIYGQDWLSQAATWNPGVTVQTMKGTNDNDVFQSNPLGNFLLSINGQIGNDYVNTPILPSSQIQSFLFKGGQGDDQFGLPGTDSGYITHIDGGSGYDTLFIEQTAGSLNSIDLTKLSHKAANIEEIDLGYANSVIFDSNSLLQILDSNRTLIINGTQSRAKPSDPTSSNWIQVGEDTTNGKIYDIYSYANTALQVWIQKGGVTWSPLPKPYSLQLLHFSDGEAGLLASQTAPYLAALVDAFDGTHANTLILAGGDNFIPSPFLSGGTDQSVRDELNAVTGSTIDLSTSVNHPIAAVDIAIHNVIGVEASTIGNHEFDLGPRVLRDAFTPGSVRGWVGAQFPYLSANLDFSGEPDLNPRFTNTTASAGLEEAITLKGRIVPSAVVIKNGEKIGLVGATTQVLEQISSTGGVEVKGFNGDGGERDDVALLASHLQPVIDDLTAQGVNKVILMAHLQQLANEKALAPLLRGVDIILAAGSNTRLGDSNDQAMAFPGHDATFADGYPMVSQGADGDPTLIVNTDNEYSYLGRLVVDFDERGRIIPASVDPLVSGAYAATSASVAKAWNVSEGNLPTTAFAEGTKGENVQDLTDAVQSVINSKDGQVWGYSTVYLEGERVLVRGQETNLGNLTADANLAYAKSVDPSVMLSLKNGGGIRSQIGAIDVLTGEKIPTAANPAAGKSEGGISTLDIENSLRFNNGLSLVTVTASKLRDLLEHGVASFPNQGRFPQVSGVAFSFDPTRPAGNRIVNMTIEDATGKDLDLIVRNGTLHGDPNRTFRLVTLDFLANGGDGYLFPTGPGANRVNLFDPSAPVTGVATFAADGKEQDVLAEYLSSRHGNLASAIQQADTSAALDLRLQNLTQRADSVVDPATLSLSALSADMAEGSIGSTPFTFTINRAGDPSVAVTVSWAVGASGPHAADALDFAGSAFPSGIATLSAGQLSQQIILNVVGDRTLEAHEAFTLSLSNPVGGTLLAGAASASGRIRNDDLPSPPAYTFSKSAEAVDEGSTLAIGVATANVVPGSQLYWRFSGVGISAADFTDGLLEGSSVLGTDGRASFSKAIAADAVNDPDEPLELRFYSDAARTQQVGSFLSVQLKQPSVGAITDGSDGITGSAADEILIGVPMGSTLRGQGSLDRLTGGGGNDLFVLGEVTGRFYDDGTPGLGSADLAVITDFNTGDRIQLNGLATDYRLISGRYGGVAGVRIDALSPTLEAIGFVQGTTLATLSLTNPSQFVFA